MLLALLERSLVQLDELLHVVGERAAVGVEANARERAQGRRLVGVQVARLEQVKAGGGAAGLRRDRRRVRFLERGDGAAERHQVGRRLVVDDDEVAGDAAPRPEAKRLRQRAQQAEALLDAGRDQDDRQVARDAEAPEQAPVADVARFGGAQVRARERERERGRERLDRREVLGVDAHLAQADAGQRRRHQRGARDVADLAVLVDHRAQRRRVVGGGGAEGQPRLGVGRDLQAHRERGDRIETGVERRAVAAFGDDRQLVEGGERMARVAVAAEPALAVDLDPDRDVRRLGLGEEVGGDQALVGDQPGLAREHDRLVVRLPLRAHEQVRERRMRFVGARVGERDLERRQQLEVERALAAVVQDDLAELDVVLGADPDRRRRFQLGPGRAEGDPVGVQAAVVVRRRVGRRDAGSARPVAAGGPSGRRRTSRARRAARRRASA